MSFERLPYTRSRFFSGHSEKIRYAKNKNTIAPLIREYHQHMNYRHIALAFTICCLVTFASAQNTPPGWKPIEYQIQSRLFHSNIQSQSFTTTVDIGVGLGRQITFEHQLSLKIGATVAYSQFGTNSQEELFISTFKRTSISHFGHASIQQLNVELPLSIQLPVIRTKSNLLHFTAGIVPQIQLFARHTGTRWGEDIVLSQSILTPDDSNMTVSGLSDLYTRSGLSYSFCNKHLSLGAGVEYSLLGRSLGSYITLGYQL